MYVCVCTVDERKQNKTKQNTQSEKLFIDDYENEWMLDEGKEDMQIVTTAY